MEHVGRRKCPGAGKFTTVLITCCSLQLGPGIALDLARYFLPVLC